MITDSDRQFFRAAFVRSQGYRDLDLPTILASGEIGIYYVNSEATLGDKGAWEKFGDDSEAMIRHATAQMEVNPDFEEMIMRMARHVDELFADIPQDARVISGGQRRDWLFSGPVAKVLDLPHISLFKQEKGFDRADILTSRGLSSLNEGQSTDLARYQPVHVFDLLTKGSSMYHVEEGIPRGWLPMLRNRGAQVSNLVGLVSRKQGGEEHLSEQGVGVDTYVAIDEQFLRASSRNPERAVAYFGNPAAWSSAYLRQNGALTFIDDFNPEGKKLPRAKAFVGLHGNTLRSAGKFEELRTAVKDRYGTDINDYRSGEQ